MAVSDNDLFLFSVCAGRFIAYDEAMRRADSKGELAQMLSTLRNPPRPDEDGDAIPQSSSPHRPNPTLGAESAHLDAHDDDRGGGET